MASFAGLENDRREIGRCPFFKYQKGVGYIYIYVVQYLEARLCIWFPHHGWQSEKLWCFCYNYKHFVPDVRGIELVMKPSSLIKSIISYNSGRYKGVYIMTLEVRMLPY